MALRDSEKQNIDRTHLSQVYEDLCFHYFYIEWKFIEGIGQYCLIIPALTSIYYSSLF